MRKHSLSLVVASALAVACGKARGADRETDPGAGAGDGRTTVQTSVTSGHSPVDALRADAEVAEAAGDIASARQFLNQALQIDPGNAAVRGTLARLNSAASGDVAGGFGDSVGPAPIATSAGPQSSDVRGVGAIGALASGYGARTGLATALGVGTAPGGTGAPAGTAAQGGEVDRKAVGGAAPAFSPVSPGAATQVMGTADGGAVNSRITNAPVAATASAAGDVVAASAPDVHPGAPGAAAASTEEARSAAGVGAAVAEYATAIEARDLERLGHVYPGMTEEQRRAWARFFGSVADLRAQLVVDQLTVDGATARARVRGTYEYQNLRPHRAERSPVSFQATLARDGAGWRVRAVE